MKELVGWPRGELCFRRQKDIKMARKKLGALDERSNALLTLRDFFVRR